MSKHPDEFGDRMKQLEGIEAKRRFIPGLPICTRIDGRTFSKFTRPFDKPFDSRLSSAMRTTARMLVEQTHARIGYVQSDEISLIFMADEGSQVFFDGRIQKLASVLAGMATAFFIRSLDAAVESRGESISVPLYPHFDARVWQVPSKTEAANTLLWRAQDARKNGISSACRSMCSAKSMHLKGQTDMVQMMMDKGVDYYRVYSTGDRLGTWYQRESIYEWIDDETWAKIPDAKKIDMKRTVARSVVTAMPIDYFGNCTNREAIIFEGATPEV